MKRILYTLCLLFTCSIVGAQSFLFTDCTSKFEHIRLGNDAMVNQIISIKYNDLYFDPDRHFGINGFYTIFPDTIWYNHKKKPKPDIDYRIDTIFHPYKLAGTDPKAIGGHSFVIESLVKIPIKQYRSKCYDYYLKDLQTGERLRWRVPESYSDLKGYDNATEPLNIFLTISKECKNELIGNIYYLEVKNENAYGLHYERVKCVDLDFCLSPYFKPYFFLLLQNNNGTYYRYDSYKNEYYTVRIENGKEIKDYWSSKTRLITEDYYNELRAIEINKKKELVTYDIALVNVEKSKKIYKPATPNTYSDAFVDFSWKFEEKKNHFGFILNNKTSSSMKIAWNEAMFVNPNNIACRVVHKDNAYTGSPNQTPTIIPSKAKVIDVIAPVEEYYTINNDAFVKIIIPLDINNKIFEYTFTFKYNTAFVFPLLQSFDPNNFNSDEEAEEYFQKCLKKYVN